MATALTDEQKHLLNNYEPALDAANFGDHYDTVVDELIVASADIDVLEAALTLDYAIAAAGTPSSETAGPPDYIDVPFTVVDEDGSAIAVRVNLRVRIFDDAAMTTPSTVGAHRLTTDGTTPVIRGDDSIDADYRTSATGTGDIRVEDVSGGSGASQYLLITDGGNEGFRVRGGSATVTFN